MAYARAFLRLADQKLRGFTDGTGAPQPCPPYSDSDAQASNAAPYDSVRRGINTPKISSVSGTSEDTVAPNSLRKASSVQLCMAQIAKKHQEQNLLKKRGTRKGWFPLGEIPEYSISGGVQFARFPSARSCSETALDAKLAKHRRNCLRECASAAVELDQRIFRNFWPLLDDSRDYARLNGCRFMSRSFDGIRGDAGTMKLDHDNREKGEGMAVTFGESNHVDADLKAAKSRAAPTVYQFAQRIRAAEPGLLEELEKAFRIVIAESVRSAMIATCQLLELWPPSPRPSGVAVDDCAFEDVAAPIPIIAQRLHNDETRRELLTKRTGDPNPMRRRAMMAIYIVEFAVAAGATLPEPPETYQMMLNDFNSLVARWQQP